MTICETQNLRRYYGHGEEAVKAVDGVSFSITQGSFTAITGPSGSGKSTLLHLLGGLDRPTEGKVLFRGKDLYANREDALSILRRRQFGFVFQSFNLISKLTAEENVELPLIYQKVPKAQRKERVAAALARVELQKRAKHLPTELSGGQQQRVAIARAIATRPSLILADEPTGNLDSNSTKEIMDILKGLHNEGRTAILITHDNDIAAQAKRVIKIKDGKVESDSGQIVPVEELRTTGA